LSPFVDNEAQGYIPDRQREINTLAGVETAVIAQAESDNEDKQESKESDSDVEPEKKAVKDGNKGDADSSSDEEMVDESEEKPTKQAAKKVNTVAMKNAKNEKLKKDLQKEQ
jgi:hypothetical protein